MREKSNNVPIVEVKGLYKRIQFIEALSNVSLTVSEFDNCLILGPNGSGKSTLIKVISGLLKPTKGEVRVFGFDPFREFSRLKNVVHVALEDYNPPWWVKGMEFLKYISIIRNVKLSKTLDLAEYFNLTPYLNRYVRTYSAGMKKKLGLIQALVGNLSYLFLMIHFQL